MPSIDSSLFEQASLFLHTVSSVKEHRILAEDSDDILPATFAFIVFAVTWGILACHALCREIMKKDVAILRGAFTEVLFLVGINAIIMGVTQLGYFPIFIYALSGIVIVMFFRDIWTAYVFSRENNEAAIQRAFPQLIFSDSFRERYISSMTGDLKTMTTENAYGDFRATDFRRILLLSLGQLLLLASFVAGLVIRRAPPFEDRQSYTFYWIGILMEACYVAGKEQLIAPYDNFNFFVNALRAARNKMTCIRVNELTGKENVQTQFVLDYSDLRLWIRFILSMLINSTGLILIMATLPMQLSWSDDPTEFVLNAVAAFFIFELDDLPHPVEYRLYETQSEATAEREPEISLDGPKVAVSLFR